MPSLAHCRLMQWIDEWLEDESIKLRILGPHLKQWYVTPRIIIIIIRNHIICHGVHMSRRECITFVRPRIPWNRERFH